MASFQTDRDADDPEEIRRNMGAVDSDYLNYLRTGYLDSAAKKGEPGAAEQDGPGAAEQDESGAAAQNEPGEQVDPDYIIFLNSLEMINNLWYVRADERNKLLGDYKLEIVSDGELDQYMQWEKVNLVGHDIDNELPFSPKMNMKRKIDYTDPIDPNHSEDEKHDTADNISCKQRGYSEKCNPMLSEVYELAKRGKLEVDNVDTDLMSYLESKIVPTDGHMRRNLKSATLIGRPEKRSPTHIGRPKTRSPEHIGRPKTRSPEHIGSSKPRSHTHMRKSEPKSPAYMESYKFKFSEHIPSSKIKSSTQSSKMRSESSKLNKPPAHSGSFKPESPRHIQRSKPEPNVRIQRSSFNSEPPARIRTSNMNDGDNVCFGGQSAGNSEFAANFRDVKSKVCYKLEDDVDEDDDLVCLGSQSAETSTFRENLMRVLSKPFDKQELRSLEEKAKSSKKVEKLVDLRNGREKLVATDKDGKAFIDHYPDLRRKLKACASDSLKRLNLLRGFFFWIQ